MATMRVLDRTDPSLPAADGPNDIYVDATGQLVFAEDEDAVLVACEQAVKAQLGEMPYAATTGVPYDQVLWSGSADLVQFEYWIVQAILSVPNVIRVTTIEVSQSANTVSYSAEIESAFGQVFLNGGV